MKRLLGIVSDFTAVEPEEINDSSDLKNDLGADSVTLMEIFGAIEIAYEIEEIPENELNEVKTFGDIRKLIRKYTLSI